MEKKPADPQSILRFYFARKRPLAEAKVLVVGQGSVGKTSLIKYWLTGKPCDGSEEKTTKIDITRTTLVIPRPDGSKMLDVTLNVWDFGGQEIYHATHQFFLTRRSLYLLVLDARLDEDQNNIHYWFQVIRSFGGDSPVLVVINKSEQHHLELNETRLRKDYGEQFAGVVRVSCKKPFGRDELAEAIRTQLGRLKDVFNDLPEPYFVVKAELEKKARKLNFLPYTEYAKLCKKKDLKEVIDQTTLIRFLHDLGVVLNFNDEGNPYKLKDTTILNPQWVTEGVYAIINDNRLVQDRGVLTRKHLTRILPDNTYPADKKDVIVEMMHRFELCFGFPEAKGEQWLVPELLLKEEQDLDWRERESLNFQYHYEVLPGGLICRFIVRMHPYIKSRTYWRSGVVLDVGGQRVLVRGDTARGRVFITVQGPAGGRRAALNVVRQEFRAIHATVPWLRVTERVPLPDNPDVTVDYQHLLKLEARGVKTHYPEGGERDYEVRELLEGVTTLAERIQDRVWYNIHVEGDWVMGRKQEFEFDKPKFEGPVFFGDIRDQAEVVFGQIPPQPDKPDLPRILAELVAQIEAALKNNEIDEPGEATKAVQEATAIGEMAQAPKQPGILDRAKEAVVRIGGLLMGVASVASKLGELRKAVAGWFAG